MKFRERIRVLLLGEVKHLLELHCVTALFPRLSRVCALAKLAVDDANVRVIDVPIDVVVREVSVQAFAHLIGQTAQRDDVVGMKEVDAFLKGKALTVVDLVRDCAPVDHAAQNYT